MVECVHRNDMELHKSAQLGTERKAKSSPKVDAQFGLNLSPQPLNFIFGRRFASTDTTAFGAIACAATATAALSDQRTQTLAVWEKLRNFSALRNLPSLGGHAT